MTSGQNVSVRERQGTSGLYTNDISVRGHNIIADEPQSLGGADLGPTPFEYLSAALGACTTITLRMYAARKKWSVAHIACDVVHETQTSADGKMADVFIRHITLNGALDIDQRARMIEIARKCPVHKTLSHSSKIETIEVTV